LPRRNITIHQKVDGRKEEEMARRIGALQRNIQNLSRAINKIDPELKDKTYGIQYQISDVKMGINDFTFKKDGKITKVRYDEIKNLSNFEQASILNKLSAERYDLRQKKALEDFSKKGQVSKSFLRTVAKDNPALAESIKEFQDIVKMPKEDVAERFQKIDFQKTSLMKLMNSFKLRVQTSYLISMMCTAQRLVSNK
jgi:ribosomal protein L29